MSIQAAKEELNSLTDFQRDIHVTKDLSEEIISTFYRTFVKATWYSSVPLKLKCSSDGEEVVYSVNNTFHYLMYSYMRFELPPISVLPEFNKTIRAAWCHNVGTNIVKRASFIEDDDTYNSWDNIWADIYFQFYQRGGAGKRDAHKIGVGNIPYIENWATKLPRYPINVEQPWFYSMHPALSFPIFYKNSQTRAEHRYTFRRRIVDLLRVQKLGKDEIWYNVSSKAASRYLNIDAEASVKMPELWGRYAYVSAAEIDWNKCRKERVLYTRDVEICDTANPNVYKTTADIELHCTNPCLAMFWVAENLDATATRNYSNYSTDPDDFRTGWDPVRTTSFKYGTTIRLDNMPSDHFSIAEPRMHFPSAPDEPGYHGYSFAYDSTSFDGDIGIVFSNLNAKLQCRIANGDIFSDSYNDGFGKDTSESMSRTEMSMRGGDEDEELSDDDEIQKEEPSPKFMTRARLFVLRKFTIAADAANADQYRFTIK
jgi:hypothetical protein